ncbi:MAG TPA: hypothetical protein VFY72_12910, partial [Beijerinckiaceae bacterium]|nr:hypothetical protein [Beijerinckiaceae bacterium]
MPHDVADCFSPEIFLAVGTDARGAPRGCLGALRIFNESLTRWLPDIAFERLARTEDKMGKAAPSRFRAERNER